MDSNSIAERQAALQDLVAAGSLEQVSNLGASLLEDVKDSGGSFETFTDDEDEEEASDSEASVSDTAAPTAQPNEDDPTPPQRQSTETEETGVHRDSQGGKSFMESFTMMRPQVSSQIPQNMFSPLTAQIRSIHGDKRGEDSQTHSRNHSSALQYAPLPPLDQGKSDAVGGGSTLPAHDGERKHEMAGTSQPTGTPEMEMSPVTKTRRVIPASQGTHTRYGAGLTPAQLHHQVARSEKLIVALVPPLPWDSDVQQRNSQTCKTARLVELPECDVSYTTENVIEVAVRRYLEAAVPAGDCPAGGDDGSEGSHTEVVPGTVLCCRQCALRNYLDVDAYQLLVAEVDESADLEASEHKDENTEQQPLIPELHLEIDEDFPALGPSTKPMTVNLDVPLFALRWKYAKARANTVSGEQVVTSSDEEASSGPDNWSQDGSHSRVRAKPSLWAQICCCFSRGGGAAEDDYRTDNTTEIPETSRAGS